MQPLYKGQKVMLIKTESLVSPRFIYENHPIIRNFVAGAYPKVEIDCFDLMIIWLLYESKNPISKFEPYFNSLPSDIPTPLLASEKEWEKLPSQLYELVSQEVTEWKNKFEKIKIIQNTTTRPLRGFRDLKWKDFRRSLYLISIFLFIEFRKNFNF